MSDQKLRDLERRWRESGAVEDEAAYLLERVRAGDLSRERLELAAYCDYPAALTALGSPRCPTTVGASIGHAIGAGFLDLDDAKRLHRIIADHCLAALPGRYFSPDDQWRALLVQLRAKVRARQVDEESVRMGIEKINSLGTSRPVSIVVNVLSLLLYEPEGLDPSRLMLAQLDTLNWPRVRSGILKDFAGVLLSSSSRKRPVSLPGTDGNVLDEWLRS